MLFRVDLAKSALLLTTILADGLATTLAIMLEYHADAAESLTAQHAEARVKLVHRLQVKDLRQCILFLRTVIFQEDAVHLEGARLLPSLRSSVTVRATIIF